MLGPPHHIFASCCNEVKELFHDINNFQVINYVDFKNIIATRLKHTIELPYIQTKQGICFEIMPFQNNLKQYCESTIMSIPKLKFIRASSIHRYWTMNKWGTFKDQQTLENRKNKVLHGDMDNIFAWFRADKQCKICKLDLRKLKDKRQDRNYHIDYNSDYSTSSDGIEQLSRKVIRNPFDRNEYVRSPRCARGPLGKYPCPANSCRDFVFSPDYDFDNDKERVFPHSDEERIRINDLTKDDILSSGSDSDSDNNNDYDADNDTDNDDSHFLTEIDSVV